MTLARGCHVARDLWEEADLDHRFRLRIAAARAISRTAPVLSHAAAAYVWDLPWIGPWPDLVSATDPTRSSTRSGSLVRWHSSPLSVGEVVRYHGVAVTTPTRTSVDLALTLPFSSAVALVDGALQRGATDRARLGEALNRRCEARNAPSAGRALAFADARAESAGESMSRVSIAESRIDVPDLQKEFRDGEGLIGFVDFWWPRWGVVGEFDGDKKYLRPEFRGGRSTERVLLDEKRRADRIQALPQVRRLVRWGWREARDPALLSGRLGLPGRR
ncbi:hypothetical protein GCM10025867_13780 [Frondihabitans sucicola]|uniref:Winged helix DNA-binding domain-containing protein n=1 Tax=Frondihabitans sucicola TaxID=1268041 RepID=A0ABN6XVU0_9MICO|nr:hypothetical protein GCM10025867_13780 [Frondihabitans sucicola]